MSERGSYCTEFIYCNTCFEAFKKVLVNNDKYLRGITIPTWGYGKEEYPIIAGEIGSLIPGNEPNEFKKLISDIQENMCDSCSIRVVLIPEDGETVLFKISKNVYEMFTVDNKID